MEFSLAEQPWIPVLTNKGMDERSLLTVLDSDVRDLASGDVLEDAAILRLLVAIVIAAADQKMTAQQWISDHRDRFDLFCTQHPFGQNPDMARFIGTEGAARPIIDASYALAGSGSTAVNQFHTLSGITFSPAAAARLLLMRQAFSVGGIQQFTEAIIYETVPDTRPGKQGKTRSQAAGSAAYGKGPLSAKTAVCTNRAFVWIDAGRLEETVAVNARVCAGKPVGTFHFGWPDPATPPPIAGRPTGVLDALTWPSRSIYLVPGDPVEEIMVCDGVRWPDPKDPQYPPEREAELVPHAVFERKTAKAPATIQGVHVERVPWRQLMVGLASEQPADSVLAAAINTAADLPAGARVRIAGLGSYQARIDGPVAGSFPVPVPGVDMGALVDLISQAFVQHGSYFGSLAHASGLTDRTQSARLTGRLSGYAGLPAQLEQLAIDYACGRSTVEEASQRVAVLVDAANGAALDQFRVSHPAAAGKVAGRKASPPPPAKTGTTSRKVS